MENTLSIENVINEFKSLSIRHNMINDFGVGDTYNINSQGNMKYPFMWIEIVNYTLTTNSTTNAIPYNTMILNLNVYIFDKVRKGDTNNIHLWSDTAYILNSCIKEISQNKYYRDNLIMLVNDIIPERMSHETDSDLHGWIGNLSIKLPNRVNPCNSPIDAAFNTSI